MPLDRPKVVATLCLIDFHTPTISLVSQLVKYCFFSVTDVVGLYFNFSLHSGVCCRDICRFRCVLILVKVEQVVKEQIGVMPISFILSQDSIELNFASDHFFLRKVTYFASDHLDQFIDFYYWMEECRFILQL